MKNGSAGQAMGEKVLSWRTAEGSRVWLAGLVEAMEQAARPEIRAIPCEAWLLDEFRAQLSRPASLQLYRGTPFSFRN
jgi:hypothetical protein